LIKKAAKAEIHVAKKQKADAKLELKKARISLKQAISARASETQIIEIRQTIEIHITVITKIIIEIRVHYVKLYKAKTMIQIAVDPLKVVERAERKARILNGAHIRIKGWKSKASMKIVAMRKEKIQLRIELKEASIRTNIVASLAIESKIEKIKISMAKQKSIIKK